MIKRPLNIAQDKSIVGLAAYVRRQREIIFKMTQPRPCVPLSELTLGKLVEGPHCEIRSHRGVHDRSFSPQTQAINFAGIESGRFQGLEG